MNHSAPAVATTQAEETRYAELQRIALDAARTGGTDLLQSMLGAGLPVNLADEKGNTLLMLASYHGHEPTAALLLECGADPEQRNDRSQTPLAGVAFKGNLALVKLLVEAGADPAADQGGGRLPIHFAALFGHTEIVRYLDSCASVAAPKRWVALSQVTGWLRRVLGK